MNKEIKTSQQKIAEAAAERVRIALEEADEMCQKLDDLSEKESWDDVLGLKTNRAHKELGKG
jgi:hypothetical protein